MTLGSPGLREASHLGQPALGRPEQERRRLATLQGCMSGSGPPSSTAAHGEGSLEDTEAGRLWDTDTHTWGPRHPHPLTVPHAALNFGPAAAVPHLGLASVQRPEPATLYLCSGSCFSSLPTGSQTWGWGLGGRSPLCSYHLPSFHL